MPRQARLDAPNALRHVKVRGLERRVLFRDDADREDFVARLAALAETGALHSELADAVASVVPMHLFIPGCPPHFLTRLGGLPQLKPQGKFGLSTACQPSFYPRLTSPFLKHTSRRCKFRVFA
jgi:hypothetical protein